MAATITIAVGYRSRDANDFCMIAALTAHRWTNQHRKANQ
jgi:hypothetical protein